MIKKNKNGKHLQYTIYRKNSIQNLLFSIQIVNLYTTILSKDNKLNKYSVDSDAKKEQ